MAQGIDADGGDASGSVHDSPVRDQRMCTDQLFLYSDDGLGSKAWSRVGVGAGLGGVPSAGIFLPN